jgi:Pyruvate/2-oxoacid:ferredoxin oxidoreductase gamma subunit
MDHEILLTGIGGQGIQLAAKTLATAAMGDGRSAMVFGTYGGSMRGGRTESTVVISDGEVQAPPTVSRAWSAIGLHHLYWSDTGPKLRPGAVAVIDVDVFRGDIGDAAFPIHASKIAAGLGSPKAVSMVAIGALAAATELLSLEALVEATAHVLPSYRAEHAAANAEAIRAGFALVDRPVRRAWAKLGVAV